MVLGGAKDLVGEIEAKIEKMHERSKKTPLESQKPAERLVSIEQMLAGVREIGAKLSMLETASESENAKVETKKIGEELAGLEKFLKRNINFEQQKLARPKQNGFFDEPADPGVYAGVEERISSVSMKLWYLLEKALIGLKANEPQFQMHGNSNFLEIIRAREAELEEYKKKYNDLLSQGLSARIAGDTSVELEEAVQSYAGRIGGSTAKLHESLVQTAKKIEDAQKAHAETSQRANALEHILQGYTPKTAELAALLKKEKEQMQKTFTDMNAETARLRAMYSKKIMDLEEDKANAMKEARQRFEEKHREVMLELKQKDEFLGHSKQVVEEKEARIRKLGEENAALREKLKLKRKKGKKHKGKKK